MQLRRLVLWGQTESPSLPYSAFYHLCGLEKVNFSEPQVATLQNDMLNPKELTGML